MSGDDMSEQIQDQMSAFTDDELSPEECAFLVRRLERDPETRDRVLRYSIIGAALRGELPNPDPDVLRKRVRAELDGVRTPAPSQDSTTVQRRYFRPVVGLGIAASVAVAALAMLYAINSPIGPAGPEAQVAGVPAGVAGQDNPPSYVVPSEAVGPLTLGDSLSPPPIRLTNYLITHGQYAPGIRRTSIHTNVISNEGTTVLLTPPPVQDR
jgi:negative regulator of sigma E activity